MEQGPTKSRVVPGQQGGLRSGQETGIGHPAANQHRPPGKRQPQHQIARQARRNPAFPSGWRHGTRHPPIVRAGHQPAPSGASRSSARLGRPGLLAKISRSFAEADINISQASVKTTGDRAVVDLQVEIGGLKVLNDVLREVQRIDGVHSAGRA